MSESKEMMGNSGTSAVVDSSVFSKFDNLYSASVESFIWRCRDSATLLQACVFNIQEYVVFMIEIIREMSLNLYDCPRHLFSSYTGKKNYNDPVIKILRIRKPLLPNNDLHSFGTKGDKKRKLWEENNEEAITEKYMSHFTKNYKESRRKRRNNETPEGLLLAVLNFDWFDQNKTNQSHHCGNVTNLSRRLACLHSCVQNKNFLSVLNKLDIDVKQFPDLTFDGLFENIPENTNNFFNWFIENISSDNVLTQSEQAIYYELESTQSLPTEEELNYVLSSCNPSYEELMSVDVNYIKNYLSKDLEDLTKNYAQLSDIYADTELNCSNTIKKQNKLKEKITTQKKLLNTFQQESEEINLSFCNKIDEVKSFLLEKPNLTLNFEKINELLVREGNVFNKFKNCQLLELGRVHCPKLDLLNELEKDLTCVDFSLILSEGFLKGSKAKIEFLSELLQKSFNNYNTAQFYLSSNDEVDFKISGEIKILESELFEKQVNVSHGEVQKILDDYLLRKIDLNNFHNVKVTECRDYMKSNWKMNSFLHHILQKCISFFEDVLKTRKQLSSKLIEYEMNVSSDVTNLELRNQRFKEVSLHENQHPLAVALKNIMSLKESPINNEGTLKNVMELMLYVNDDSNFISVKFRNDLQSSIKSFNNKMICGPTNQVLFTPIELLIKFQECSERNNKLSLVVKRLASKYVDAKETILKSNRKRLLLWINFLLNQKAV